MKPNYVYDPTLRDPLSSARGGGRVIQLLRDYCSKDITFIDDPSKAPSDSTLVMPFWFPFHPPQTIRSSAEKRALIIFDVIPLKYPHYFPIGLKGQIFKWVNYIQARSYDHVITISETAKKDIVKYLNIPEKKVSVVYLTIGKNFQKTGPPMNNGSLKKQSFCLYVGDVNWNKNLLNLARAIKLGDIPCVFVGRPFNKQNRENILDKSTINPWLADFKEFLTIAGDDEKFVFPENVSDANLSWLYQSALCNILISFDEGFGLSYIEASHFSTPSILSDTPIFHEIAGDNALFVNPNKPTEVKQAIDVLVSDKKLKKSLSDKARERSLFFSPKLFSQSFISSIKDL